MLICLGSSKSSQMWGWACSTSCGGNKHHEHHDWQQHHLSGYMKKCPHFELTKPQSMLCALNAAWSSMREAATRSGRSASAVSAQPSHRHQPATLQLPHKPLTNFHPAASPSPRTRHMHRTKHLVKDQTAQEVTSPTYPTLWVGAWACRAVRPVCWTSWTRPAWPMWRVWCRCAA